jgi:phosphatidylglycerol lysyltransferase
MTTESTRGVLSVWKTAAVWLVGHASRFVPLLVIGAVLTLTWQTLRQVHPRDIVGALRTMSWAWLLIAAALTLVNIVVMGLYDVVAFEGTRTRALERWRYGAVAFAWSNFLTLGPFAGPAIRFWLYRGTVEHGADLETGVLSIAIAFASGLVGWTLATVVVPSHSTLGNAVVLTIVAAALVYACACVGRFVAVRFERFDDIDPRPTKAIVPAIVGWLDWLLAGLVFLACLHSTGDTVADVRSIRSFFLGQAIGLASLVPGGFGSSDAFWIAHIDLPGSSTAAALLAYRLVYYIVPWAAASLVLLSWATRRASRRIEMARRMLAGLVAAGGALILLSTASPGLSPRLDLLGQVVPLPIVEISHVAAALTGVLLLVLARGLAKGYRIALGATIIVLLLAAISAILKGLDYEEALILACLAVATWSQAPLYDREAQVAWFKGPDLAVAAIALFLFLGFGAFAYRITPERLERVKDFGYRVQRGRFLRTAGTLAIAVSAGAFYVFLRVPVRFRRLSRSEIDRTLELHAAIGRGTTPLMVANGDKAVFRFDDRGFCLYRTIGSYLVVFGDPVVSTPDERDDFLTALFAYAAEIDRRPLFYQISLEWIPPLHDRGYAFFKLGEEAHVRLDTVTLDGPQGKLYRQILRRGERDHLRMGILPPVDIPGALPELRAISDDWLRRRHQRERQFSIGFFDEDYLRRFPCAVVEEKRGRESFSGDMVAETENDSRPHIFAFANLLRDPRREELSVDLMRYRSDGPGVMDFLFVSLFLYGKEQGYKRFNLGMAPLASVGELHGAHARERLANLLFQHGENWYNFQGLRFYKEKFDPEWAPRYMAYQNAWEWPAAITHVSALIAGGWRNVMFPKQTG